MIESQLDSTNEIVASVERVSEGIDAVCIGLDEVSEGINGLKAAFEWGIAEVVWQLEQNRIVLKNILKILMAPLDTQAKERRKRAEEAYANGWVEDAEEEFIESEKLNKFDFSIHISLGIIYLFHKIDKLKSLSYFEKAIKYSKPKSPFHASYALLHKALIHFDMNKTEEAVKASHEAVSLSPNFSEALYQNAQYNAQLLNTSMSIENLEKAIRLDKLYCLKADKDKLFDPIRGSVNELFENLRKEEKKHSQISFAKLSQKHNTSNSIFINISKQNITDPSPWIIKSNELLKGIKKIRSRIDRDSYFDYLEINNKIAPRIYQKQNELFSQVEKRIKSIADESQKGIREAESDHEKRLKKYYSTTILMLIIGSFVFPSVAVLIAGEGWDKLRALYFCIPVFSQIISLYNLFKLLTEYSAMDTEDLFVWWSIVIYLIIPICYLVIVKTSSEGNMKSKIKKESSLSQKASSCLQKLKNL